MGSQLLSHPYNLRPLTQGLAGHAHPNASSSAACWEATGSVAAVAPGVAIVDAGFLPRHNFE